MRLNRRFIAFLAGIGASAAAPAEIVLSQLVVELAGTNRARDVEIYNDSDDRAYILVQPREILEPGTPRQSSRMFADPEKLGLLVSPRKLILEPRQRRVIRIADLQEGNDRERIYRVTVKPQVGDVQSEASGLKLLVGYDLLVIVRPEHIKPTALTARRIGDDLEITNNGNVSVELDAGLQCATSGKDCRSLGGKRLYAGATWSVKLPYATPTSFKVRTPAGWKTATF